MYLVFTLGVRDTSALSFSIRSFRYASALKLSPITSSGMSFSSISAFIRQAINIHLINIPATYYPCPFFFILFWQVFDNFVNARSG